MFNKNEFLKSKFLRSIILVVTGTAFAQLISILFTPILTRLYSPESFGLLGSFNAIISFVLPIAALNYPSSIVLAQNETEKNNIVKLSLLIVILTSSICSLVILTNKQEILNLINVEALSNLLQFIPVAMVFYVLSSIAEQTTIRDHKFKLYAKVSTFHSLILNTSKYILGLIWPTAKSLIIVTTIGYIARALMLAVGLRRDLNKDKTLNKQDGFHVNLSELKLTAKKYKDFPLYRTPQIIINSFSQNLPVLMLASYFGASSAGFFTLSRMVLAAPVALIGQSVSTVFYPKFHKTYYSKENCFKLLLKTNLSLLTLGSIPLGILIFIAPWLFAILFGDEWRSAGEFSRWLSIWILVSLSAQPSVAAIPVLNIQGEYLVFEVIALTARFLSLYISYTIDYNALETIRTFALTNFVLDLILIIFVLYKANKLTNKIK